VFFIALAVGAAFLASGTVVFIPAIVNAVLAVWSNGVVFNYRGDPVDRPPQLAILLQLFTLFGTVIIALVALVLRIVA
jgi:hypothetical protein